jgi:uncharacterized membrane protein YvbJ
MALILCTQCGNDIADNALFCPRCGAKQDQRSRHLGGEAKRQLETARRRTEFFFWGGMFGVIPGLFFPVVLAITDYQANTVIGVGLLTIVFFPLIGAVTGFYLAGQSD